MNEEDVKIKTRIEEIFPSPQVAAAVVDIVVHGKKPAGWSRHSRATYYNEDYAKSIRADIDRMIASKQRLIYRYEKWCNEETGLSPGTLYSRINQSVRYLCEQMDPTNIYKRWYQQIKLERIRGLGIVLSYKVGIQAEGPNLSADLVEPREKLPAWKCRLEDWLEDDSPIFVAENLALNPEEIAALQIEMAQLSNVVVSVTSSTIKGMKLK